MSARSWTYLAILLGLVFHGALLPFTYGQTYDAYIHMFFGNHYSYSWFDPWEPRWYTGFTVTAYPPGSHQALGLLIKFIDMRVAYILLQLLAVALLIIGVFRFSRLWVNDMAAAYAAMLCVFSSAISETLHIFGQLPTLLSIALFLNAIPHISDWIEKGKKTDLCLAVALTAATTAVHHVTPLFGTVFFVAPIGLAAWLSNLKQRENSKPEGLIAMARWASPAFIRGIIMGVLMLILIVTIVFPYWHWSITDPITQVSIPHGSRENFVSKPNLGLMFFVIPWGLMIFVVPYMFKKSFRTPLWPLGASAAVALFLGTGGTTPFPKILLGAAFEILTLDRFTFWATLLILPFGGLAIQSLWGGRGKLLMQRAFGPFISRAGLVFSMVCFVGLAIATALLPTVRPTQPDFIDPAPIVKFMDEDNHADWRYLTLGFGDQFAYHSALINAESVDGNYHSARRLPSLTNYAVERLENSKYGGVPGLASLNQFLTNAEKFHLKYVFSNDEFYDPVLHYTGWNPVTRLNNGVRVWEKPDISPLPDVRPRRDLPHYQKLMWGILPIGALSLGLLTLTGLALTQRLISAKANPFMSEHPSRPTVPFGPLHIYGLRLLPLLVVLPITAYVISSIRQPAASAETIVEQFYQHLDFRETEKAFALLKPNEEIDYGQFLRIQKLTGGLVPSFGKLTSVSAIETILNENTATVKAKLVYLTSVGNRDVLANVNLEKEDPDGPWQITYMPPPKAFSRALISNQNTTTFRDMTASRLFTPTDPIQRLARPEFEITYAAFFLRDGRLYLGGRIRNISQFPACAKIFARTQSKDSSISLEQHAGRVGAHRLLPGENSAFRIDFEGYLKIKDQAFNAVYDPEQFSVPELETLPDSLSLDLTTAVCAPTYYKSIAFSEFKLSETKDESALSLKIANIGTEIVNTLQLKISYLNGENELTWIDSYYLQNNLIPGEERVISVPLSKLNPVSNIPIESVSVNGQEAAIEARSHVQTGIKLPGNAGQILIDYDAMIYQPLD